MTIDLGAVPITGFISPTDNIDTYATHKDIYGKGGYRTVDDLNALNSISTERRQEGMLVYVLDENKLYQLIGGIDNANWVISQIVPPLPEDYIFKGNDLGVAEASPALIDINLDIVGINERLDQMSSATVLLSTSNPQFINAEVLADKPNGFLFHVGGILTTLNPLDLVHLPALTHNYTWVGNNINRATEVLFELNNIPNNGNININNYEVVNASDPTTPQALATKNYVDNAIASGGLPVTITGAVTGSGIGTINTIFVENPVFLGNKSITIPVGGTADRNPTPTAGEIRLNTDL